MREVFYRESDHFIEWIDGGYVGKVSYEGEHVYVYVRE